MNERITVGASVLVGSLTGGIRGVLAAWPVPARGRHRATKTVPELESLPGTPSAYTTPDFGDVPVRGVLAQAWKPCNGPCGQEMPSVLHVDGSWQCDHCLAVSGAQHAVGGA